MSAHFSKKNILLYTRGVTLLEIIIVISILSIIAFMAVPQFSLMRQRQNLENATTDVVTSLNKASSQTAIGLASSEYGVHFQSDRAVIFKGTTYSAGDANNETITIVIPATISSITLSGGGSDVYFARLTGLPSKTGTVTVSAGSMSRTITIGATGTVSVN